MRKVYPVILTPINIGFHVFIPDFNVNTQGRSLYEAICMARNVIGLLGIDMQKENIELPSPSAFENLSFKDNEIVSFVDIDFLEFKNNRLYNGL